MPIYRLGGLCPTISRTAYVHPDAVVIGDVTVGPRSSVWPATVLRGDHGPIRIGPLVAIQDGTVIHGNVAGETVVGERSVVGHLAHLEGCRIGARCLVGSGSLVMPLSEVADDAVVAAGAVLPRGTTVPTGATALGVPATVRMDMPVSPRVQSAVERHAALGERYRAELRQVELGDVLD